jgi:hypothetical protein
LSAQCRPTTPTAAPALDWPHAVQQVEAALCAKLRLAAPPERIRQALDLVLAHAVTLHNDGSASVQSGVQTFILAPYCSCSDATQRPEWCTHTLAVELHRRAVTLMGDPTPPALAASAPEAPPSPAPASGSGTTAWLVQEAPVSACFTWRVGQAELLYTFRGLTDDEVLDRTQAYLPRLQAILAACDPHGAAPAVPQAPQTPPVTPTPPPQDTPHAGHPTASQITSQRHDQRQHASGDQATGWCSLHDVAMEQHSNARGTWCSHKADGRYCKGAK